MAYGDQTTAYALLRRKATESEIRAAGTCGIEAGCETVKFQDGSFIELRKFNNHQAFLSNGWNVTPLTPAKE